jgi:hypothetical protein
MSDDKDDWKLITPLEYRLWENQSWGGGPGLPWSERFRGNVTLMAIAKGRKACNGRHLLELKALHGG